MAENEALVDDLNIMAQTLEATGDYRVIRRLKARPRTIQPPGAPVRLGLVVDVETTGLDPRRDEIIELAMTPFMLWPGWRYFQR